MSALDNCNVAIVVFAMPGCEHCEEYLPRLSKQVEVFQQYGHPFVFVEDPSLVVNRGQIPILVLDATSQDPGLQAFANQWQVTGMPTTVLLMRRGGGGKQEGALDEAQIYELLGQATKANR